jgi:hypothetical protein
MSELPPPPPSQAPAPSRRRGAWRWLVIVLGVVILVGVAAAALVKSGGEDPAAASVGPSVTPTPAPPNTPADLRAAAGAFQVKLTWHAGTGDGSATDRYDIQRDDQVVGHADADATSWLDQDVVPGQTYAYQVIAVGAEGRRSRASVQVKTKSAPPGTAALIGTFDVKVHATSHTGFSTFERERYSSGWRFQPDCDRPPCDTQLRDIHVKDFIVTLDQADGTYHGSDSTSFGTCNGHTVSSSFTVTLHVTRAGEVHGEWRVTKISGTMSQYASAQLGCVSTSATFEFVGTALKG